MAQGENPISMVQFIFKRISVYVFVPVILLNIVVVLVLCYVMTEAIFVPLNNTLAIMHSTFRSTEQELNVIRENLTHTINEGMRAGERDAQINQRVIKLLDSSPVIYGIAYGYVPADRDYGVYIHKNNQDSITITSLPGFYSSLKSHYSQRGWFKYAWQTGAPYTLPPYVNLLGNALNIITYAFPVKQHQKIKMITAVDVPVAQLNGFLKQLDGISRLSYHNITVYYTSHPSGTVHNIATPDEPVPPGRVQLLLAQVQKLPADSRWHFSHGFFYHMVDGLNGSVNFIVLFDTSLIAFLTLFWLVLMVLFVISQRRMLKSSLTKRLLEVGQPIKHLSEAARHLAANNLDQPLFSKKHGPEIHEVINLHDSFEQMRANLQQLLATERRFEKYQGEMELAAKIQQKFMRSELETAVDCPPLRAVVYAAHQAAGKLSGDVYDLVTHPDALYCFIGDTSGKDVTAAVYSSFVLAQLNVLLELSTSPEKVMDRLNDYLCRTDAEDMFISAICLRIDLRQKEICFAIAGHDIPLFHFDGQRYHMPYDDADPVLGILPGYHYRRYLLPLQERTQLVLYTDGITEAANPDKVFYGYQALETFVSHFMQQHPEGGNLSAALLEASNKYEQGSSRDDKTVITIEVLTPSPLPA
ncbi:MAG: SpoIIE family protein phosphatase [Enterobacteriaceae bacterium]